MLVNTLKTRLGGSITHNKNVKRKILLTLLVLILVITIFSTITFASSTKDIEDGDNEIVEAKDTSTISKFGDIIKDFISEGLRNSKRVPTFRLVTRYQKDENSPIIEKATRLKLFSPMSIDVNGDHFKDVRVWIFRLPGIDLHPPAVSIKNVFLIRRLPGMNNIKYDFFEIYLEYNPKIITKLFYLTKDIDRVRVGYQSPVGEEVPKTCIITDKIVPHLIYPMKKVTHKISVNPCSIVGKENLSLIFAMADLEDETVISELIMQVNYTPAIRVSEIIFEREKTKLFGRGQSLEITRTGGTPSNVTLFIKELMWRGLTIVKQGSITVENIPKKIKLEWLIGRTGYIDINTHNDEVGRVRAVFNNTVVVGFVPKNNMSGRVSWEDRTLIGVLAHAPPIWGVDLKGLDTFNLSFSVRDSFILEDFSLIATNQENATNKYLLESKASSIFLDLDAGADFGNVTAEYWLFPIYFFPTDPSQSLTVDIDIKNLILKAENFTFNVKTNASETDTTEGNVNDSPNASFLAKYFEVSSEDANIFLGINPAIIAEAKLGLDMHIKDTVFSGNKIANNISYKANGSFSSLDFSASGASSLSLSEMAEISVVVNGSFELNNFSLQGNNFLSVEAFNASGDINCNIVKNETDSNISTSITSLKGGGNLTIKNLYSKNSQNKVQKFDLFHMSGEISFSRNNISSNYSCYNEILLKGIGRILILNLTEDSSDGNITQIDEFSLSLEGTYSDYQRGNSTSHSTNKFLKGNGTLEIENYYSRDHWNNTLTCDFFKFSGEYLRFSTNISSESFFDSRIESIGGKLEVRNITIDWPYNIRHIDEFSSSPEEIHSEQQLGNFTAITNNTTLQNNTVSVNNNHLKSSVIKSTISSSINNCSQDNVSTSSPTNGYIKGNINAPLKITYSQDKVNETLFKCDLLYISVTEYIFTNISSDAKFYTEILNGTITTKNVYIKDYQNNILKWDLLNFSGENLLFNTSNSTGLQSRTEILNGTLTIKNYYNKDYWNNTIKCDFFKFSGENLLFNTYNSTGLQSHIEILNGTITTKNVYIKDYQNNILKWDLLNLSGKSLLFSTENNKIESFEGALEIRKFEGMNYKIDLFKISGDWMLTYDHIYDLWSFDGDATFEIRNWLGPSISFKSLTLTLNGDITFKGWNTYYYDNHILLESKNGFTGHLVIERNGGYFDTVDIEGTFGSGYIHLGGHWGDDGFVFVDSSEMVDFIDLACTFMNTTNNKSIRFSRSSSDFDADVFLFQWDTITLDLPNLHAIPYNWYITGSLSRDIDIDIISGNNVYHLWPLGDSGNSNEETENTEETSYNSGYGIEPLGNVMPPNKPQKPKGPTGGIVIGRIVKGHNYTFTTITSGNGQYVSYNWSWGDGTYSGWSPFIKSGIGVTGSHTWNPGTCPKTYQIKVKAKNINGEESAWSDPLTITVRENFFDDGQNNYQNDELVEQSQNNYYQGQNQNNNQGQPNNS